MTKKEIADLVLSKIPEDKKEPFISEIRVANNKKEKLEIIKKYAGTLTAEEINSMKGTNEISDEEIDQAAGGCSCNYHTDCQCLSG